MYEPLTNARTTIAVHFKPDREAFFVLYFYVFSSPLKACIAYSTLLQITFNPGLRLLFPPSAIEHTTCQQTKYYTYN